MRRRTFIGAGLSTATAVALAGCTGGDSDGAGSDDGTGEETRTPRQQESSPDELPDGVYIQPFIEGMSMQGTAEAGEYRVGVMYSAPHRFWRMVGDERKTIPIKDGDAVHLMAVVWDPETGTVIPDTGLSVEISRDGDSFDEQVIYPMLSQAMGFHYGANFPLDGDGTYTVRVDVGALNIRRTGAFEGRFDESASTTVDIEFTPETRDETEFRELDSYGQPGAIEPMDMMMPLGVAPDPETLPGEVVGSTVTDGAELVAAAVREGPPVGDDHYLAVSARTRYNGLLLPAAEFEATVERDGETVFDGLLDRAVDPDLDYHYGVAVDSLRPGDELTVSPVTPPQTARHEGYERAFNDMEPVTYTL